MNILQVTGDLYPYTHGGIGIVVDTLSNALSKKGVNVDVMTFFSNDNKNRIFYSIITCKQQFAFYGNPISIPMLFELFKLRKRYDIIHAHSHLYYSTFACAIVRIFGSSKLIITNHGLYSQTAPMSVSKLWLKTFGILIYKLADTIICLSENDKKELVKLGINKSKIIVLPNWVDTENFSPKKEIRQENRLLFVGRLVHGKGANFLIDSLKYVSKETPGVKLVIVGSGPEESKLRNMVSKFNLRSNVEFKKNLNLPSLIEEYQKASIFILPSLTEGLPLTILEAMACGTPIITTNILSRIIKDAGIVVSYGSTSELVSAINFLLNDKYLRETMGENARSIAKKNHDSKRYLDDILTIYNGIASGVI